LPGYDLAGNRTSLIVPSGTTAFIFDALNRLDTVLDPDNGLSEYSYDDVGNRETVTRANGTVTSYTYDTLNRLTLLENWATDTSLISSYAYTLGLAGNRLRVEEHSGRRVDYSYDQLYRLTDEQILVPGVGSSLISYAYDKVDNRLDKIVNGVTETSTYNHNDRLLSDGTASYSYDDNGNLTHKSMGSDFQLSLK
jgi:YD repeat-containing protein